MRRILAKIVGASFALSLGTMASAQELQLNIEAEVEERAYATLIQTAPEQPIFPLRDYAQARSWVQLIWNGSSKQLERRRYEVLDPMTESGAVPFWEPTRQYDNNTASTAPSLIGSDLINGRGVLTWRPKGAVRYGRDNVIAQFQGTLVEGRFHGRGLWVHSAGSVYEGLWKDGLMHGVGQMTLPSGSVYNGNFRDGLFHGRGVMISADGTVQQGTFSQGFMDGLAQVSQADGVIFSARFKAGEELQGTRSAPSSDWPGLLLAQARSGSGVKGLSVSVAADERAPVCCTNGPPTLGYKIRSSAENLTILPNADKLMAMWYGRGNIQAGIDPFDRDQFDEKAGVTVDNGPLNYTAKHVQPVRIQFGLKNQLGHGVRVERAYLDMESSRLDARPLLQSMNADPTALQNYEYVVENFGWAKVLSPKLVVRFVGKNGRKSGVHTIPINSFNDYILMSLEPALRAEGVPIQRFNGAEMACKDTACVERLIASDTFGNLGKMVVIHDPFFGIDVEGKLEFQWENADGRTASSSSPFGTFVSFGAFRSNAECEGGTVRTVRGQKPLNLAVGKGKRRIPVDIEGAVSAGRTERWRISFQAKRSSTHRFSLVYVLSNGSEVRSRAVKLNFFRPKYIPASTHNYGGIC